MCTYSVKWYLYNTYCSNISCLHLWHSFHAADLSKFNVYFNNAARLFFGYDRSCSASGMFIQERLTGFDATYRKSVWNFVSHISNSENCIIYALLFSDLASTSPIRKAWSRALYGCWAELSLSAPFVLHCFFRLESANKDSVCLSVCLLVIFRWLFYCIVLNNKNAVH